MNISTILDGAAQHFPSDLLLQEGSPPAVRIHGILNSTKVPALTESDLKEMLTEITPDSLWKQIEQKKDVEFIHAEPPKTRYRVTLFHSNGQLIASIRILPYETPSLSLLELPPVFKEISDFKQGLVLISGRSGSGRSCTTASLIESINSNHTRHIVEVSNCPEFSHLSKKSFISQIPPGTESSMETVLEQLLHYNADVVILDEIRDWTTARQALRLCDAGTLVIANCLAVTAQDALENLIRIIPESSRQNFLQNLALNLQAISCQRLCRKKKGKGRAVATEIIRNAPILTTALIEQDFNRIEKLIQSGQSDMRSFDQDLDRLVRAEHISEQEALRQTLSPDSMQMLLRGFGARTK